MADKVQPSAALKRIAETGDPLAKYQRDIIGASVRIHIPLRDVVSLRNTAVYLRTLASILDTLSRDTKRQDFEVLFDARSRIKLADNAIRKGWPATE